MMDNTEITIQELKKWRPDEYHLVDVRDEMSYSYGHLPGAEHIPEQQILDGWVPEEDGKKTVLYCKGRDKPGGSGISPGEGAYRIQPAGWLSGVAR